MHIGHIDKDILDDDDDDDDATNDAFGPRLFELQWNLFSRDSLWTEAGVP